MRLLAGPLDIRMYPGQHPTKRLPGDDLSLLWIVLGASSPVFHIPNHAFNRCTKAQIHPNIQGKHASL